MRNFMLYFIMISILTLLIQILDIPSSLLVFFIILHITFQIGAIISIINEDILYSKKKKQKRVLMVIFIPIIGILKEYNNTKKYIKKDTRDSSDTTTGDAAYFTGINASMLNFDNTNESGGAD